MRGVLLVCFTAAALALSAGCISMEIEDGIINAEIGMSDSGTAGGQNEVKR